MGWIWERAVHPDDWESMKSIWLDCLTNVKVYETEFRIRRYDGTYRWFLGRANPCCKFTSFYISSSVDRRHYVGKCISLFFMLTIVHAVISCIVAFNKG
jgi:PAS domain-containing protein